MPSLRGSRGSSRSAPGGFPAPPPPVAPREPTDRVCVLAALAAFGVLFGAVLLAIVTTGCTIERVVLYETVNYPVTIMATPRADAIFPHARTP